MDQLNQILNSLLSLLSLTNGSQIRMDHQIRMAQMHHQLNQHLDHPLTQSITFFKN